VIRFYYFSLFSWIAYGVLVFIAIVLLWLVWTKLLRLKVRNPLYWVLIASIVIGPWGEELWISYKFERFCGKDTGIFIYKTVKVDGFYDDTTGWGPRQLAASGYRYVESRDILHKKLMRVERADEAARDSALAWYAKVHPDEKRPKNLYLVYPVNDKEQVVVSPDRVDAWRVTTIAHPTARYEYKTIANHAPVAHEIERFEDIVADRQSGEVIGRFASYYRGPYWFFISLGAPTIPCEETQAATRKYGSLLYRVVLNPMK